MLAYIISMLLSVSTSLNSDDLVIGIFPLVSKSIALFIESSTDDAIFFLLFD